MQNILSLPHIFTKGLIQRFNLSNMCMLRLPLCKPKPTHSKWRHYGLIPAKLFVGLAQNKVRVFPVEGKDLLTKKAINKRKQGMSLNNKTCKRSWFACHWYSVSSVTSERNLCWTKNWDAVDWPDNLSIPLWPPHPQPNEEEMIKSQPAEEVILGLFVSVPDGHLQQLFLVVIQMQVELFQPTWVKRAPDHFAFVLFIA